MNKQTAVRMESSEYGRPFVGSGVTLPISIREVPGSNIDRNIDHHYSGFTWYSSNSTDKCRYGTSNYFLQTYCYSFSPSWLRHYATSRKVTGSSPDEVIGFFNLPNWNRRTMALDSTQPLIEMSTINLSRVLRAADA
jgi:hypothetical protein